MWIQIRVQPVIISSVVDPDPHGSKTFAWIRIRIQLTLSFHSFCLLLRNLTSWMGIRIPIFNMGAYLGGKMIAYPCRSVSGSAVLVFIFSVLLSNSFPLWFWVDKLITKDEEHYTYKKRSECRKSKKNIFLCFISEIN